MRVCAWGWGWGGGRWGRLMFVCAGAKNCAGERGVVAILCVGIARAQLLYCVCVRVCLCIHKFYHIYFLYMHHLFHHLTSHFRLNPTSPNGSPSPIPTAQICNI